MLKHLIAGSVLAAALVSFAANSLGYAMGGNATAILWGIADDNTWLSEFSSGRKDFPLLFDDNHNPKKAFDAVMDF